MNNAEVTPQRACHRPIPTSHGLWPVKEATCGQLPIWGRDMLHRRPTAYRRQVHRLPPTSPPPVAHFLTASPPPTNRLPATRPPPCHRLATPCAQSARCHQPTSCQPPAHHYVARRPTTASPSPSHPTSAKKVIYDPQSFCVYPSCASS